ncbi:hypothetical protein BZG36_02482 [Bifiguratus adelaidae]|uniref:heme oxygenase (biliverdin-producing) n=1 Tax=Bifiguratus adelaidae TaxID=1938954 RepID=A0A261Y0Z7_9FUNG|nr:hypothetical protein BZG36_02482 [Bifiguratus adelaidae]
MAEEGLFTEEGLRQVKEKCPAFQSGLPERASFEDFVAQIPKDHPTVKSGIFDVQTAEGRTLYAAFSNIARELEGMEQNGRVATPPILAVEISGPAGVELANAMRESTKQVHRLAERSTFTKRFLRGQLSRQEYRVFLVALFHVYSSLETALQRNAQHPVISMIHFPHELNRVTALLQDLQFYYPEIPTSQLTDPNQTPIPPAVQDYCAAIQEAGDSNPELLVAHSYTRYLGDLSGGQILAKRLKVAILGIDETDPQWDSSEGTAFYAFPNIGNVDEFKTMYRDRLNELHVSTRGAEHIINEAVRAFELNINMFDAMGHMAEAETARSASKDVSPRSSRNPELRATTTRRDLLVVSLVVGVGVAGLMRYRDSTLVRRLASALRDWFHGMRG